MKKSTLIEGNPNCVHKWVKRDKVSFSVLKRACTDCGQVELHSECADLDEAAAKKLLKE